MKMTDKDRAELIHAMTADRICATTGVCLDDVPRCYCLDEIKRIKVFLDAVRAEERETYTESTARVGKLEGELGYARTWIAYSARGHHQQASMIARIDRVLAQPAPEAPESRSRDGTQGGTTKRGG